VADGGEPGVDSRDEGKHTGKTDLLFVKTKLWSWRGYSGPMCNKQKKLNHDAIESFPLPYRCHKNRPWTCCGYHMYTEYRPLAVAKFSSKSTM